MPLSELDRLLRRQSGVVSRRQALDLGETATSIRRRLRWQEWVVVHDGVYVNHTGPLTRLQRQWAAVLSVAPAALHRNSALEAHGLDRDRHLHTVGDPIDVAVDSARTVTPPAGVRVERIRGWAKWIQPSRRPPRVTVELAALKEASARGGARAIAVLADVCRQGLTTPARLVAALDELTRLPGRNALREVLADVASGAHSVLEHRYLRDVERAHGLPTGARQVRSTRTPVASSGTCATPTDEPWWSSTAASVTATPKTDGTTSTAT